MVRKFLSSLKLCPVRVPFSDSFEVIVFSYAEIWKCGRSVVAFSTFLSFSMLFAYQDTRSHPTRKAFTSQFTISWFTDVITDLLFSFIFNF